MAENKAQTEMLLDQFNKNFKRSRKEMINRFLQDQEDLNKKFEEYSLFSDEDKQLNNGNGIITAEYVDRNYGGKKNDETDSITSLMTQCSFSDSEDHGKKSVKQSASSVKRKPRVKDPTKQMVHSDNKPDSNGTENKTQRPQSASKSKDEVCQRLSLSTPRFGVPERKEPAFGRSKSLRMPSKTPVSTMITSHPEQPPNSPEEVRKNINGVSSSKPPIDNIRTGRKTQDKPKKLLTKRSIRPKTAMGGLQTNEIAPLFPENDNITPDRLQNQSMLGWEQDSLRTGTVRSAPLANRHRFVSWDTEQPIEGQSQFSSRRNSLGRSKVPALPMSVSSKKDNTNPTYAPDYDNTEKKVIKVSRSKSINHAKPFVKSSSDYFPSSQVNRVEYGVMNVVETTSTNTSSKQGSLRRYKGHNNLTRGEGSRGTQVAVLKLPPVSKKKNTEIPSRSSTSLGYFRNETPIMKMRPVHIGEEF